MSMIENRGIIKLDETVEPSPDEEIIVIEAYDESERLRAHQLMTENWQLISLTRHRGSDGVHYTEYQLRAPWSPHHRA